MEGEGKKAAANAESAANLASVGAYAALGSQNDETTTIAAPVQLFRKDVLETSMYGRSDYVARPLVSLDQKGDITFRVPPQNNLYPVPSSFRLAGEFRVQKKETGAAAFTDCVAADKDKVSLCQFAPQALFESLRLNFNGAAAGFLATNNYGFKCFLENSSVYGPEAAENHLICEGYAKDGEDGSLWDAAGTTDAGMKTRSKWLTEGPIAFSCPVRGDIFECGKLLPDMLSMDVVLTRSDDDYVLIAAATSSADPAVAYRIKIDDLRLEYSKISLINPVKEYIDQQMRPKNHMSPGMGVNAVYPITRTQIKTYYVTKGNTDFHWDNIVVGKLPFFFMAVLRSQVAAMGSIKKNPFRLQHFKCTELFFRFNNQDLPVNHYRPKYVGNAGVAEYGRVLDNMKTGRFNSANLLTYNKWKDGLACYPVDVSPDQCSGLHTHVNSTGTLSLVGKFGAENGELDENIAVDVYMCFNDEVQFDYARNIYAEGAVAPT